MKIQNPFIKPLTEYRRDLNFYEAYCKDQALALSLQTGKDPKLCEDWVRKTTGPGGQFAIVDPKVSLLRKVSEGNRELDSMTMSEYLRTVTQRRYPMAPTFTAYEHPEVRESILAKYVKLQLANRNANKKLMLKYDNEGNKLLKGIYKNRQNRNKIKNNSISGAHGTSSSVLFNQSSHSTLTSTCRSASSTTNGMLERFLTGNRHYFSHTVVINNIASVLNNVNYDDVLFAMNQYGIRYPSYDEVICAIERCTSLYWSRSLNPTLFSKIERLVAGMSELQRAAYLFTGDLWHLEKFASEAIKDWFWFLAEPATMPVENPSEWISKLGGDEIALLSITCDPWILKDGKVKNLFTEATKASENYGLIGATAKKICAGMEKYTPLIKAFFATENMPCGMSYFPYSVRRSVVASDTDSSIFTTQDWIEWYTGKLQWSQSAFNVNGATTYLCSLYTAHTLAMLSANMGVAHMHMDRLQMKNEYAFPVFSLTSMGKHYFASKASTEGNVYDAPEWEIKGANLKNSKAPPELMQEADALIKGVIMTVMENGQVDLKQILTDVAIKETNIHKSLIAGDPDFFSRAQIKAKKGYKSENSVYLQYVMWEQVFAPKYGSTQAPPYAAIKVSLDLDSPTKVKEWLAGMKDQALAQRMELWMLENKKTTLGTVYLPRLALGGKGIPVEFIERMAIRNLIWGIMHTYYLILESLGFYLKNKDLTKLIYDDLHNDTAIELVTDIVSVEIAA